MIKDRIKELRRVKASDLIPNPKNWRKHPDSQRKAIKSVLDSIGYADALIARETPDGLMLIDGHLRSDVTPDQEVPVLIVNLTEEEADIMLATLDPLAGMADTDSSQLTALLESINFDDAIGGLLDDIAKDNKIDLHPVVKDEPGVLIDKADELQEVWNVQAGDVWQVGRHRLMCGDCTVNENVKRLMDGKKKYSVLTDPPYNISYDYESCDDNLSIKKYSTFCKTWFSVWCVNSVATIITPGPRNIDKYPIFKDIGIWIKKNATAGASVFHYRTAESVLFYGKFKRDRVIDVFDYSSGFTNELANARKVAKCADKYPPAKSMKLWVDLIQMLNVSCIVDVFLGNGTTMLAAEQTNRICYGMEIEPKYCAVTLQRMQDAGLIPQRVTDE